MKIVVLGAGNVGTFLVGTLFREGHDITVIDRDPAVIDRINNTFDVLTITGNGSSPVVLRESGLEDADLLLSVTSIDEINLLASIYAREMGVSRIVCRVSNEDYIRENWYIDHSAQSVIRFVHPISVITREILNLIRHSAVNSFYDFADGKIQVLELNIDRKSNFTGVPMHTLARRYSSLSFRIMAITRDGQAFVPGANDQIEVGDHVYIVTKTEEQPLLFKHTGHMDQIAHNVMIYGGGPYALNLAATIERFHGMNLKLIESGQKESMLAATGLDHTLVLQGDATDLDMLAREGIMDMDLFIALSDDEENNLISSLMARHLGVKRTITMIGNSDYMPIAKTIGLDVTVHKQISTASKILRHIRRGRIMKIQSLQEVDAQIIEYQVDERCPVLKKSVRNMNLPAGSLLCAVYSNKGAVIPDGESVIQAGDRVTVFAMKEAIPGIEKLFGNS